MHPRLVTIVCSLIGLTSASGAQMDAETLSVLRVQPLLKEKCLGCHGDDPDKIKSDYDMRSAEGIFSGGESEVAAVVAKEPEKSPLYLSVIRDHDIWEAMPPKDAEALTTEQIQWIRDWIAGGAPWPNEARVTEIQKTADKWLKADGITVETANPLSEDWANRRYKKDDLWAYQPVQKPAIPSGANPIDLLVESALPEGLDVAPPTDARTLVRRATFDLTGLPPTADEVAEFIDAYESDRESSVRNLVDRLLESPHYGERMARHWLDVVRYADSSGFANDFERGNTWRYRDYVIRAFNDDKPYDEFVKEQIAGDEIDSKDSEKLIATGFLRMGPWELTGMEVAKIARQRFLDDVTNAVGETFLAHSLQCARCHDHKFDPVPTHDYYAIQAVFATTQLAERQAPFLPEENTANFEEKKYLKDREAEYNQNLAELQALQVKAARQWFVDQQLDTGAFDKALASFKKNSKSKPNWGTLRSRLIKDKVPESKLPPKNVGFTPKEFGRSTVARKGLQRLMWEKDRFEPIAFSVYNGKTPDITAVYKPMRMPNDPMAKGELEETCILGGGDPFSPTTPVKPGVLSAIETFNPEVSATIPLSPKGRRTELAEWIVDPQNPLTARTLVNRVWLWHFGQPIAGNPNNFGSTGKKPTHPKLLDWLAATFVETGWSIKELHRIIMTSATYQRAAQHPNPDVLKEKDPLNQHYASFLPRRLTAEEFRDAMLAVSGELKPELGGIPVRPEMNLEAALQPRQVMGTFASAWVPNPLPSQRHRRSIYVQKIRGLRDPFMEVFNEPGPDFSCEQRDASTVTPQVFSLFNSETSSNRALALANSLLKTHPEADDKMILEKLFQRSFGRSPSDTEFGTCIAHWKRMIQKHQSIEPRRTEVPTVVTREAVEEKTGEKFTFDETLFPYQDFVPDLQPADVDARTRALSEICLVLLNSNEFAYIY